MIGWRRVAIRTPAGMHGGDVVAPLLQKRPCRQQDIG